VTPYSIPLSGPCFTEEASTNVANRATPPKKDGLCTNVPMDLSFVIRAVIAGIRTPFKKHHLPAVYESTAGAQRQENFC